MISNFSPISFKGRVSDIKAREILDSRGNPTVEVDVFSKDAITGKTMGRAAVPSGASTGSREALELRDKDPFRFLGKGVLKAVDNANRIIASMLKGFDVQKQRKIDNAMINYDGTHFKERLGANAILGVSLACTRAAAQEQDLPLYKYINKLYEGNDNGENAVTMPVPLMNIVNGGAHADSGLSIQEFMVVPVGAESVKEAVRMGAETFHTLKGILKERGHTTSVGDEGGFAPKLKSNEEALDVVTEAIKKAGYEGKIKIALDVAASELYDKETKLYKLGDDEELTSKELADYYKGLTEKYPIISIEDGMAEGDSEGWKLHTKSLGKEIQIVGDDVFVTNAEIFQKEGIDEGVANSILVKVNQIGTLSETLDTLKLAKDNKYTTVISHRSGETEDAFIADLAVGVNAGQIKTGAPSRSDRTAKYNQLMRIEEELGDKAIYAGIDAFKR